MSLSKKSKLILTVIFIVSIVLLFIVTKIIYAPHEKTADVESAYKGKASDFITSINIDTTITAGIVIELSGRVTSVLDSTITIDNNIFCQFSNQPIPINLGENVLVKGRYIGFDDIMGEVKLDNCILKKEIYD